MEEMRHSCFQHPVRTETPVFMDIYLDLVYSLSLTLYSCFPLNHSSGCLFSCCCDIFHLPVLTQALDCAQLRCFLDIHPPVSIVTTQEIIRIIR